MAYHYSTRPIRHTFIQSGVLNRPPQWVVACFLASKDFWGKVGWFIPRQGIFFFFFSGDQLFQVPGLSYNWWGFQARDTLQIEQTTVALTRLKPVWNDKSIALNSKIWLMRSLVMDPHSRAPKKNTSHGNEVLPQDTTHLLQRPCYQRGSPCQDPAGTRTTRRPPDHRKETQTAVVWSHLLLIWSGQNHLARHSERGKMTRQTE